MAARHSSPWRGSGPKLPTPGRHPLCFVGGSPMIRRTLYAVLLAVFLLVGGAAWYLLRPEKAFIDDVVDEPFPGGGSPGAAPAPHSDTPPRAPLRRLGGR